LWRSASLKNNEKKYELTRDNLLTPRLWKHNQDKFKEKKGKKKYKDQFPINKKLNDKIKKTNKKSTRVKL